MKMIWQYVSVREWQQLDMGVIATVAATQLSAHNRSPSLILTQREIKQSETGVRADGMCLAECVYMRD